MLPEEQACSRRFVCPSVYLSIHPSVCLSVRPKPLSWLRKNWHFVISLLFILETRSMCSLPKEQFILSRETIQNAFFRIMPHFWLIKTWTFCNISVFTEDIYLKLRVCVHFPKSNPYYQGRQFKMLFFYFLELYPFINLKISSSMKHSSQALLPACGALVLI